MGNPQQAKGIEKGIKKSKPVSPKVFAEPTSAVEANDLHTEPAVAGTKTPESSDEALKRANEEKLAGLEKRIHSDEFSDAEKEFVDLATENYLKKLWAAKKSTEEARKITDDRWAFKFRQKYIKDRVRLGSEKKRGGSNGLLDPEKAKLFKEYLELKLSDEIPEEKPEINEDKSSAVDPLKNQDIIGETGRVKIAKVSTDERAPEFPDVPLTPEERMNLTGIEQVPIVPEPKPEEVSVFAPEKTLEELKANWDASADEYKKARGHAKGSRGFLTKLLGLSKKGFSENVEEMEEVKNARSKYLQDREAHLNAWKESAFKEYQEELESKKGTVSEEELKQMRESFGAKLEDMAKYHNTIADLELQDGFTKEAVEYYKTKGGPLGKVFGKYIDLYNNVYLKKVPPKMRAAISIAMMGGAVAGLAGAFGVAGGFAAGAALVSRPVRFFLAPLMPAMTYTGTGKMIEKGQKWLRAKKAEKKTTAAGEIIEKMKSGEVSVEDTMKNLDELLKRQSGEYGEELVKRGWTEDRCEQARNILTIFVGARAAMVLMSGTEAISSFFEAKGSVAGAVGASPKGALYTQGPDGKIKITPQGTEAIEHPNAKPAQLLPQEQEHLQKLAASGSQVKTGGFVQEAMNRPAAVADYKPSEDILYEHDAQGKITGLSSYGEQYFKGLNIEPHESDPGSYDQFQKSSVVPEHEIKTSDMRAPDAESQVAALGNRELGFSKVQSGGGIEKSAQSIIKANPKAFGLNPDEPGFKGKVGEKAHELTEGLAKKLGFEGKGGFQRFNEIVSHHVQPGDEIRVYHDAATGKFNLTYNGKAFGNGVFTGDVSQAVPTEEITSNKPRIAVENAKPKTSMMEHRSSKGSSEIAEMKEIEANYQQDLANRKYARAVRAEQDLSALHARQASHLENVSYEATFRQSMHTRGLLKNIIHDAGIGNNVSLWDESAEKWYGKFANMEKLVSQDVLHNDDITDINKKREILKAIFSQLPKPRPGENTWQAFLRNISEDPNNLVKINRALGRR